MAKKRTIRSIPQQRTPVGEQDPHERARNFAEVNHGYHRDDAVRESERCLFCEDPACVAGCPVGIDIPGFIRKIGEGDFRGAYQVITDTNLLPAICGRVCPQENQCEGPCAVGAALEPVAIGRLERWVGDQAIAEKWFKVPPIERNAFRIGIVPEVSAAAAAWLVPLGAVLMTVFIIHATGCLEGLLTTGYEKIVMDADRCSAMMRFVQGVDFSETAQAMEAFHEVPPGGHFLGATHTQAHFESAFWMGEMSDNGTYEQWAAEGALWEHERAALRVRKLIADYQPPEMDIAVRESLDDFVARRSRDLQGET